jgi:flagellin
VGFNSINTNSGAMTALQVLGGINQELATTQNRISTGLKVASAKDNGAIWAIAQNQRSDIMALDAVKASLQRGQSTVDVAISAGETISDLLNQMRTLALAASDVSLDTNSRSALATDFASLRDQISKTISNASFNGNNLLASGAANFSALASADGSSKLTVRAQVMALSSGVAGAIITFTAGATFTSAGSASAMLASLGASITNVNSAVARLGTSAKSLDTHFSFIDKLQDTLTVSVGNLVDADMAMESARLQALQVRQQLAIKALAIANQSTSLLLQLFR